MCIVQETVKVTLSFINFTLESLSSDTLPCMRVIDELFIHSFIHLFVLSSTRKRVYTQYSVEQDTKA